VVDELSATVEHPLMVVPLEVKATVPVGVGGPAGDTDAVNLTASPKVEGFTLEATAVVVAVNAAGFTTCDRSPLLPA
jgi:hypothetical protein